MDCLVLTIAVARLVRERDRQWILLPLLLGPVLLISTYPPHDWLIGTVATVQINHFINKRTTTTRRDKGIPHFHKFHGIFWCFSIFCAWIVKKKNDRQRKLIALLYISLFALFYENLIQVCILLLWELFVLTSVC